MELKKEDRRREAGAVSGTQAKLKNMKMDNENGKNVTATGASETPEPAVGGTRAPQKSSSPSSAESVDVLRQASTANHGVGNTTVGAGAKQACTGDRKVASVTAEATTGIENGTAAEKLRAATKQLGSKLCSQQDVLDLLFEKASHLEIASKKTHSPTVSSAIKDLLDAVNVIQRIRVEVTSAFNHSMQCVKSMISTSDLRTPARRECKDAATTTEVARAHVGRDAKHAATNTASPQAVPEKQRKQQQQRQKQQQQQQKQQQQQQKQRQKGKKRKRLQNKPQQLESPQHLQEGKQKHQPQQQQPQQRQPKEQQTWSEVVKKTRPPKPSRQPRSTADQVAVLRKRTPRSMAVTIDRPAEGGSLASVMKKVSGSINLQSLGVKVLTTRKTRAGGILLEVEGNEKATLLAGKIREVVGDAARVRLPETRTPILLLGVPEWAEAEDVVAGVTQAGVTGVTSENVIIRKNSGGRGEFVASLHLPVKDAIALAEKKAVSVQWTRCRVKLLANNQPTCFRCQGKGHLAAECRGEAKPRRCHRCRKEDHLVKDCAQQKQTQQKKQPQTSTSETPAEANGAV